MCETERRTLFCSVPVGTNIATSAEYLCVKLREGGEPAKTLLLQALLDIHQSKAMRVNMKEPVELEPLKKIDEIRRFSNKELRLMKQPMGSLLKHSEYSGSIRKKVIPLCVRNCWNGI